MPRPLRLEYEDAYYHVMNRGRGDENIFHSEEYFHAFLTTLAEAHNRFDLQILCYCLMSNHYHLLVKTPQANLGRVMRHINGIYTQRHNRLKKTDGPLFRGRYKAIVIEQDSYQLQVSRYIHLNPLEADMVDNIEEYPWSSYRYFTSRRKQPEWLYPSEILSQLGRNHAKANYKSFVELGIDEETEQFYDKGNMMPYLGSDDFRAWVYQQREAEEDKISEQEKFQFKMDMDEIITKVAELFHVSIESIKQGNRGKKNIPRWVAMYLCQEIGDHRFIDIAHKFGLSRTGSIPANIVKAKALIESDSELKSEIVQYFT